MYRSILVALDGSTAARAALEEAIGLARAHGARLTLISVAVPPRWGVGWPCFVPYPTLEELRNGAREILAQAERRVPADVSVSTIVRTGPAAEAILARAEAAEHDLIVMGSRGLGSVGSILLGSVTRAVRAHSAVPVLVTRAEDARRLPQAVAK